MSAQQYVDVLAATFGVSVDNEVLEDVVVREILDVMTLFDDIQKRIAGSKFHVGVMGEQATEDGYCEPGRRHGEVAQKDRNILESYLE